MAEKALINLFKNIIDDCNFINLSTINQDAIPESRAMLNLRNSAAFPKLKKLFTDDFTFYFTTNASSAKVKQIALNKTASVYFARENDFKGLLFTGEIEVIENEKIKQKFWQEGWTIYYKGGAQDPDYALLKFISKNYKYYSGNFEVVSGKI